MSPEKIKQLLQNVKDNQVDIDSALNQLKTMPVKDLGHTVIDTHRHHRTGQPEVIYCAGKTPKQVVDIMQVMAEKQINILATRADVDIWQEVRKYFTKAHYNALGQVITLQFNTVKIDSQNYIAIVCAGTSDLYVVEEAYQTVLALGKHAIKVIDVGVAGIHRLFNRIDEINGAKVVIVVAGMEGALASVVGGLTDKPVIAVPTSVGYGVSFGGISALLTMLNSCASGITVVNIDNGFGAAYAAVQILSLLNS